MRLDPGAFNRFLSGIGQDCLWRRAFACPCLNPHSGAALASCVHCGGRGRIWQAAVAARLGTSGQDVQRAWREFGVYEDGDQVVIVPSDSPAYGIGPYDRVTSLNRTEPFSQNITSGVNRPLGFAVASVDKVLAIGAGDELLELPLPSVLADGTLAWPAGEPPQGTYSITGRRRAEFFVFRDMPFDRPHHAGAELPRRVVLRRFDLYA